MTANKKRTPLRARDMTLITLFAALIAICSWLTIPSPIPVTMQTFAIFFALLSLGGRRGNLCVILYLLMGAVGFPVFSGFQGGLGILFGPSGGYLLGFAVAAVLFRLIAIPARNSLARKLTGCIAALLGCYVFGTFWYMAFYSGSDLRGALLVCILPFIVPDFIKLTLAVVLSRHLDRYLQ